MGMVPGIILIASGTRDGIPQLVSTVSLTNWYGTAVRTIPYVPVCFLPSRCILLVRPVL